MTSHFRDNTLLCVGTGSHPDGSRGSIPERWVEVVREGMGPEGGAGGRAELGGAWRGQLVEVNSVGQREDWTELMPTVTSANPQWEGPSKRPWLWAEAQVFPLYADQSLDVSCLEGCGFGTGTSLLFSHSVFSDSLWPHGLQHARLPSPSPSPGACSNSCPLSRWCHPTILSSVGHYSSCLHYFPALGSFPMSQFFALVGLSIGTLASASVPPMNIRDWFPLGLTGLISLQTKGLSRVFSKNTTVQKHQFFGTQPSLWFNSHIHPWLLEKP